MEKVAELMPIAPRRRASVTIATIQVAETVSKTTQKPTLTAGVRFVLRAKPAANVSP
jgi:hypothetical protein